MDPEENPLHNFTKDELIGLCGVRKRPPSLMLKDSDYYHASADTNAALPKTYDSRRIYKECIHPVTD